MTEWDLSPMAQTEIPPVRLRSGQAIARDDRASPLCGQTRIRYQHDQGQTGATGQFRTGGHREGSVVSCQISGVRLEGNGIFPQIAQIIADLLSLNLRLCEAFLLRATRLRRDVTA
jgi:hypothetical protein